MPSSGIPRKGLRNELLFSTVIFCGKSIIDHRLTIFYNTRQFFFREECILLPKFSSNKEKETAKAYEVRLEMVWCG